MASVAGRKDAGRKHFPGQHGPDRTQIARGGFQEKQERLRAIFDNVPVAFFLKDSEGRYKFINSRFADWFEIDPATVEGKTVVDMFDPERAQRYREGDRRIVETLSVEVDELEIPLPSGETRRFTLTKFPILNDGVLTDIGGVMIDVTDRKQAETALKKSEARFREFADIASDWIWECDAEDRFTFVSEGFFEVSGLRPEDLIGKTRREAYDRYYRNMIFDENEALPEHLAAYDRRELFRDVPIEYPRPDGTILYFLTSGRPVFHESGEFQGYRGTAVDVSARRRAEKNVRTALLEAESANRAKTNFMATMSHELRTPLAAIIGFSETLAAEYFGALGSRRYVEYADDIKNSGEHLLHVINDILDLSTIEVGRRRLNKESLDFRDIVLECDLMVTEKAARKEIDYVTDVPDELPFIAADERALKQILLNILSNAVKFTPEGGQINLEAKTADGTLIVEVRDTGSGIPAERLDDLTKPFIRTVPHHRKAQEGAGLGLVIVKSLVDLHGGDLSIESKLGKGTTIKVSLPYNSP